MSLGTRRCCFPSSPVRNAVKYAGYRLGREYRRLPNGLCRRLSMTKVFWDGPKSKSDSAQIRRNTP